MLLQINNRFLYTKVPEESSFEISHQHIAQSLSETMKAMCGKGLAANQVGLKVRAFAMDMGDFNIVCFNPKISSYSKDTIIWEEGCLSYPDVKKEKYRYSEIHGKWKDSEGKSQDCWLTGLDAVCFQHELDHLNGINWKDS